MPFLLGGILLSFLAVRAHAASCTTATVGSPFSTCYDIAVAASINTDQLIQYNPGLNCNTIQNGQKLCVTPGDLPSTALPPNPDGSCQTYKVVDKDSCAAIGTKYGATAAQIEQFNAKTYKWKGCANLQVGFTMCISSGTPPPIPINPNLQCGPESPGDAECPLKACCSAYGFCGITDEFCGPAPNGDSCISNCGKATLPSCGGDQLTRKVGYYAGWAATRKCNPVGIDLIDISTLTHVIYAFAVINSDMTMSFADSTDGDRLKQLVTKAAGKVKVTVAVGGWTFSEGATKDIFSTMIASKETRTAFINSANTFINNYKIDGIDIDFEYPAAAERGATPSDTPNLTLFFQELRAGLGSKVISLATPAGYWFLKGFQLDKIMPNIDMLNMMSYDYRNWDATLASSNATAMPQTSLLDITDSTLLYVKAGVDLKKVNLGLAWYGRSYKLQDASCAGYGCDMTGGGAPGKCTGESGVLGGFEIDNLMMDADARPVLDSKSQTRWFINNGDLITFDDDDTRNAKADFAKKSCFGGTMIWSIDQQIPSANSQPGAGLSIEKGVTNPLKTLWEVAKAGECTSYGTRDWSARLWNVPSGMDWTKACQQSPNMINGVRYETPDVCEDRGFLGGIVGHWLVSSTDSHCTPHWGSVTSDECVAFGKRKHYSRLWDIKSGVDWMTMCLTTPVKIDGVNYDHPDECDDKGFLGAWGVWDVDDKTCSGRWGSMKDNGCGDTLGTREWSSKLFDIIGSWEDACKQRDATVGDEYFATPSKCEKHITGIWGVFEAQDTTCGVPPCPPGKVWDYHQEGCMDCGGKSKIIATRDLPPTSNSTDAERPHLAHSSFSRRLKSHRAIAANFSLVPRSSLEARAGSGGCPSFWLPRPQPNYFPVPVDPLDYLDDHRNAEGPSAQEIASAQQVLDAFQEAWNDSFDTPTTARETGGWIYADPTNPRRIFIRRAQRNRSSPLNQLRPPPDTAAGIDLNNPESNPGGNPPAGMVLVANFHTHPMGDSYGGNPFVPSGADNINAWARGVPGIIITRRGLFGYGPERRGQLSSPRGYPNSNEEYNGQNSNGNRLGTWTPTQAPNQAEP